MLTIKDEINISSKGLRNYVHELEMHLVKSEKGLIQQEVGKEAAILNGDQYLYRAIEAESERDQLAVTVEKMREAMIDVVGLLDTMEGLAPKSTMNVSSQTLKQALSSPSSAKQIIADFRKECEAKGWVEGRTDTWKKILGHSLETGNGDLCKWIQVAMDAQATVQKEGS